MRLNFIKNNSLNFLRKEIKGIEYFPFFDQIEKEINNKKYQVVYSRDKKEIVGGCLWYEKSEKSAHIYLLFVKKLFRDKYYSKKILEHVVNQIKDHGYSKISSCVDKLNGKSIGTFLKSGFKITSFIFDKNAFLLVKDFNKKENYEILLQDLFLEEDLTKKKEILKQLLSAPILSLESLKKINTNNLNIKDRGSLNKFRYLRYLADSNKPEGLEALTELSKKIDEISKIESMLDRLKLLKYIAIHGEKDSSNKATKKLYDNLPAILKLKNPELKASLLRYLAIHLRGSGQKKVISYLEGIKNKRIKSTSLDYFTLYTENEKK